jgi:hypothetical protein
MASLAQSLKVVGAGAPPTQLKLTLSASLDKISLPGVWSRGPTYRRLDSGFLEQPLIPKAPPTPRLRIDDVNGSLRVLDLVHCPQISNMPETQSLPELRSPDVRREERKSALTFQVTALAIGFGAGLAAAFLFGWL